jgi:hypothetical protein
MAEREMYACVVDVAMDSEARRRLLGALPVLLKGLDFGYFIESARWGFLIASGLLLLFLGIIVGRIVLLVIGSSNRCDVYLSKFRLAGAIDEKVIIGSGSEGEAGFYNNTRNGEQNIVVLEVDSLGVESRIDFDKKLSFHSVPRFIGRELKGRVL